MCPDSTTYYDDNQAPPDRALFLPAHASVNTCVAPQQILLHRQKPAGALHMTRRLLSSDAQHPHLAWAVANREQKPTSYRYRPVVPNATKHGSMVTCHQLAIRTMKTTMTILMNSVIL